MKRIFCVFLCVIVLAVTVLPVFAASDLQYLDVAVEAVRPYAEPGYKYYLAFRGNGTQQFILFILSPTPEITDTTQCQLISTRIRTDLTLHETPSVRSGYYQNMSFVYTNGALAVRNEAGNPTFSLAGGNYFLDYSTAHYYKLDDFSRAINAGAQGSLLGVDTTELESLLETAKSKSGEIHTLTSWNALQSVILESETLLLDTGVAQMQVNEQVTTLQSVLDDLVLLPDSSDLRDLIATAKAIKGDGYTSASFSALASAIISAETLLTGREYTQAELAGAASTLQTAIDGLREGSPGIVNEGVIGRTVELLLATLAVVLPVALALFGLVFAINLIPAIIRKLTS